MSTALFMSKTNKQNTSTSDSLAAFSSYFCVLFTKAVTTFTAFVKKIHGPCENGAVNRRGRRINLQIFSCLGNMNGFLLCEAEMIDYWWR